MVVQGLPGCRPDCSERLRLRLCCGLLLAFDISWFPFFSLSEHVVFALRALPIAIAASVALLVALRYSKLENHWRYLQGKRHWFAILWICSLVLAGILAYLSGHLGLCISFLFVALGAFIHYRVPTSHKSFANILYWTTTVTVLTLMAGYLSGNGWKAAREIDECLGINLSASSCVERSVQKGQRRRASSRTGDFCWKRRRAPLRVQVRNGTFVSMGEYPRDIRMSRRVCLPRSARGRDEMVPLDKALTSVVHREM
jgi:hypothetical protein